MRSPVRGLLLASILAGSAVLAGGLAHADSCAAVEATPAKPVFQACEVPNIPGGGRCATYEVYENRAGGKGRKIGLHILVLPALSKTAVPDPLFWLHGGPGAAASDTAPAANGGFLEGLRADHDLVFVDQRGTGRSHSLGCDVGDDSTDLPGFFGKLFPPELVRACRQVLEKDANLALYTTSIAMDDLDEVREALGYGKIDIVAASYGSIAAQAYIRQHGDHVRAAFLTGVATPGIKQPLPFARGAQEALELLWDCDADAGCRAVFPKLKPEFDAVLARFDRGALDVRMIDPVTKRDRTVKLERENYVERLRLMLYTTTFASFVPCIVHSAFEGDWLPFESVAIAYNPGSILSRGMYLTITCSEGVPFITESEIVDQARGTFVGERRVRVHEEACREWVRGSVPASFIEPVRSAVPVLMFSGEADGSTPQWLGEGAVKYLSNGRQIEVKHYGYQVDSPCMWRKLGPVHPHGVRPRSRYFVHHRHPPTTLRHGDPRRVLDHRRVSSSRSPPFPSRHCVPLFPSPVGEGGKSPTGPRPRSLGHFAPRDDRHRAYVLRGSERFRASGSVLYFTLWLRRARIRSRRTRICSAGSQDLGVFPQSSRKRASRRQPVR
jgi:pimeloyl-ACP methyl ester carboxylesterase